MTGAAALAIGQTHDGRPVRSLTSAVLVQLRAEILACRLSPGEKLPVAALARRLGVSLSAVREALSRLAAEGLVEAEDQRGFRVSDLSLEDLADITRTRIELETLALRRSIALGDERWRDGIRRALDALAVLAVPEPGDAGPGFETWRAAHRQFHLALVAACASPWLLRFRNTLYEHSERYRFLSYGVAPRDVDGEHRRIAEAALDRDVEAAVGALGDHFTRTAAIIVDRSQEDIGWNAHTVSR
jgi:DNA-binding GntR family transcriptional regulator